MGDREDVSRKQSTPSRLCMDHSFSYPENQNLAAVGPSQLAALEPPPPTVDFSPAEIVRHELGRWRGVHVETIQVTSHERFEYSFRHKHHLLVAIENGTRYDGELFVEGLPTSTARSCSHKLILVPAGRRFFAGKIRGSSRDLYVSTSTPRLSLSIPIAASMRLTFRPGCCSRT